MTNTLKAILCIFALWAFCLPAAPKGALVSSALAAGSLEAGAPEEIRGLWVVRHTLCSKRGIAEAVAAARENGLNALFVQVRGRGETYYLSGIDPPARCLRSGGSSQAGQPFQPSDPTAVERDPDRVPDVLERIGLSEAADQAKGPGSPTLAELDFDPLAALIELAHGSGLEVHAWVNMYFTWSEDEPHPSPMHVINKHPEWITADRSGKRLDELSRQELKARWIEGLYLSPAIPEVRAYLADVVTEIAENYDVDGVHLDYVRYPGEYDGADEYSRQEFAGLYMLDPLDFLPEEDGTPAGIDRELAAELGDLWREWRTEQVTALVSEISRKVRAVRPDIVVSAAVRPDPDRASRVYAQDWVRWLKNGYLDVAAPMIYTESTSKFFQAIARLREALPDTLESRVLAGISLYNQGPRHAGEKIGVARAAALGGFVLFSYNSAIDWKGDTYLPSLKPQILGPDSGPRSP